MLMMTMIADRWRERRENKLIVFTQVFCQSHFCLLFHLLLIMAIALSLSLNSKPHSNNFTTTNKFQHKTQLPVLKDRISHKNFLSRLQSFTTMLNKPRTTQCRHFLSTTRNLKMCIYFLYVSL